MLLDIVILPPVKLRERIGKKIRQAMKNVPAVFVVDNRKLVPHLSLLHINTRKNQINKILKVIQSVSRKYEPIKIKSAGFGESEDRGVIEVVLSNSPILKRLRQEILINCHLFKTGSVPWQDWFSKLTKQASLERKKYGVPLGFKPHFTLGLVKSKDVRKIFKKLKNLKFQFLANEIAIVEINKDWQVIRILKKTRFGSK